MNVLFSYKLFQTRIEIMIIIIFSEILINITNIFFNLKRSSISKPNGVSNKHFIFKIILKKEPKEIYYVIINLLNSFS